MSDDFVSLFVMAGVLWGSFWFGLGSAKALQSAASRPFDEQGA